MCALDASLSSVTFDGTGYEEWDKRTYINEVDSLILTIDDDNNSVRDVAIASSLLDELQSSTIAISACYHRRSQKELNAIVREIVPLIIRHVTVWNCLTWLQDWDVGVGGVYVPCTYRERRPAMLPERAFSFSVQADAL